VIVILSQFPAGPHPPPDAMNYACVINAFVWFGALIYYYVDAHKWFSGPKHTIDEITIEGIDEGLSDDTQPTAKKDVVNTTKTDSH
jgi:hypothetical protein